MSATISHTINASYLLTLVTSDSLEPSSILGEDSWKNICSITTEDVIRSITEPRDNPRTYNTGRGKHNYKSSGRSGFTESSVDKTSHSFGRSGLKSPGGSNTPSWKKRSLKPKPSSFDDAMKQKIVADLNKISPKNYEVIRESLIGICSRLSDDEHPWALRLILENATKQHIYSTTYINLFKDICKCKSKDKEIANDIIMEFMNDHKHKILTEVTNGDNYDEFCSANKMKTELIGHGIVLAEAFNSGLVPLNLVGGHAVSLVKILETIRTNANDKDMKISKETTESGVSCIMEFFRTLSKTKADKEGFQKCITSISELLEEEKKDKRITPKARFALMDFVDEMTTLIKKIESSKHIYRPGCLKGKKQASS